MLQAIQFNRGVAGTRRVNRYRSQIKSTLKRTLGNVSMLYSGRWNRNAVLKKHTSLDEQSRFVQTIFCLTITHSWPKKTEPEQQDNQQEPTTYNQIKKPPKPG